LGAEFNRKSRGCLERAQRYDHSPVHQQAGERRHRGDPITRDPTDWSVSLDSGLLQQSFDLPRRTVKVRPGRTRAIGFYGDPIRFQEQHRADALAQMRGVRRRHFISI
jgi:hypothetical protein